MLSSEAVDIGLFDGVMESNVEEFQTELEEFASQVGSLQTVTLLGSLAI